ncbi:unnamed protein product [Pylaiella littoralis]
MSTCGSPDAKRPRTDIGGPVGGGDKLKVKASSVPNSPQQIQQQQQQQQQKPKEDEGNGTGAVAAGPSMTARPAGAASPDADDSEFFGDPEGEELEELLGQTPNIAELPPAVAELEEHACSDPATIRAKIATLAAKLAIGAGCNHATPLVTWKEDKAAASTCGLHQANIIAGIRMQDVLDRQTQRGEDVGYCLETRVRNQVYHEAAKDLGCYGAGNQCKAGKCMGLLGVFAGKGNAAVPTETVRALCKF